MSDMFNAVMGNKLFAKMFGMHKPVCEITNQLVHPAKLVDISDNTLAKRQYDLL